jgi:PTH1 family peptidyl-tRNA hydrolase
VRVGLVKPTTFMNLSGRVIPLLLNEPGFEFTRDLLIVVDDAAIPLGAFRLRARGSAGGHNGLKSIEAALQSQEYARLRIGVGPVPEDCDDLSEFVTAPFPRADLALLGQRWPIMIDAVGCWARDGIDEAMKQFNHLGSQAE